MNDKSHFKSALNGKGTAAIRCRMTDPEMEIDPAHGTSVAPIFPLSRVKKIMKMDKDVNLCSAESVALAAMASVSRPVAGGD